MQNHLENRLGRPKNIETTRGGLIRTSTVECWIPFGIRLCSVQPIRFEALWRPCNEWNWIEVRIGTASFAIDVYISIQSIWRYIFIVLRLYMFNIYNIIVISRIFFFAIRNGFSCVFFCVCVFIIFPMDNIVMPLLLLLLVMPPPLPPMLLLLSANTIHIALFGYYFILSCTNYD